MNFILTNANLAEWPEAIRRRIEYTNKEQNWVNTTREWREQTDNGVMIRPGDRIGRGWLKIIVDLDAKLAEIDPNYQLQQVKEKFGGLRYYAVTETDHREVFRQLIAEAEQVAAVTCEVCGERGEEVKINNWLTVRCEHHREV